MSEQDPSKLSPREFGQYLKSILDPQTSQQWTDFHAANERIRQSREKLGRELPPPRDRFDGALDPQSERLFDDIFSSGMDTESKARIKASIMKAIAAEPHPVPDIEQPMELFNFHDNF